MKLALSVLVCFTLFGVHHGYNVRPGPLVIATKGQVWPKPQHQETGNGFMVVRPQVFKFQVINENCQILQDALQRYTSIIKKAARVSHHRKTNAIPKVISWEDDENFKGYLDVLNVNLTQPCEDNDIPDSEMHEKYTLHVNMPTGEQHLRSKTIWGILRGLETFSQLLYSAGDGVQDLKVNSTVIKDHPRFYHRGLLLDTSRHYMPMFTIYQLLDGMSYNKLNVFHWHIVDDQSFPYQSKAFPELSENGAYHKDMIYTPQDVQKVIKYAANRGIRVMVEFDTPGHTRSWGEGRPEILTPCYTNSEPNGFLGPIDPTKKTTYSFLEAFFKEVVEVFPEKYVHLGGDEVDFDCWQSNPDITAWMEKNDMDGDYAELEEYYIQKIVDIIDGMNASSIVWEEVFLNGVQLPQQTIVHSWLAQDVVPKATKKGYRAIWSNCWYLDHLDTGGDWQKYYKCDPHGSFNLTPEQEKLVIGGEACMWSESVDATNVVQRVWPRASAAAEKLWSAKSVTDIHEASKRLEEHACRMNVRGIPAQPPNGPGFCL